MCMTPITLKTDNPVTVPCGKCPQCYKRRVSQWSFRLMQQERLCDSSHFLTLTYDNDKVYITKKRFMGLCKRDLQLFFKRLRKAHTTISKTDRAISSQPIKYYAVGEYGGRTNRPHYHIILFNANVELIAQSWDLGQIHYGDVSGASIGYCMKYMSKISRIPLHANDDRIKEFALMSKGLGKEYLTAEMISFHLADKNNRMFCQTSDGKKIAMPRYYKERVYEKNERKLIGEHLRKEQIKKELEAASSDSTLTHRRDEAIKAAFTKMQLDRYKNQKL